MAENPIIIHSARLVTDGHDVSEGWVRLDGGNVTHRGERDAWREVRTGDEEILDASEIAGHGAVVTAGMVDLHGHGGAGATYDDGVEAVRTARALHRAHGTTRAVISLVTARVEQLEERIAMIAQLAREAPDVLGSHLEGPFLDPGHHGAHDPDLMRRPDPELIDRVMTAGVLGGTQTIRQVTLAPERPGGIEAVRRIVAAGAAAAVGHTDADSATMREAVAAGASVVTHAFNAMPGIHHRRPGPLPIAMGDERVVLELIADGVHVDAEVMKMLLRAAPGRVALVTDAMSATGMADGDYRLGGLDVEVTDGVARVRGTETIAGSTLTQDAALRRIVGLGTPLPEAVDAVTRTPARVLGLDGRLGTLRPGAAGDIVLWDANLHPRRVWTAGTEAEAKVAGSSG